MSIDVDIIDASKAVKSVNSSDMKLYDGHMLNILCSSYIDVNCMNIYVTSDLICNVNTSHDESEPTGD